MKKILVLMVALCVLCLTGCDNTPKVPNEMTIREDIEESATFQEYKERADLKITNLEIVKRQTTPEDKIDKVWVAVDASSDSVESKMYYCVTYCLYNEGWIFEEEAVYNTEDWTFTPLCGLSEEEALTFLPYGAEITGVYICLEENASTFNYKYVESHKWCDIIYTGEIAFSFGNDYGYNCRGGWFYGGKLYEDAYENWNLDGEWSFYNPKNGWTTCLYLNGIDEIVGEQFDEIPEYYSTSYREPSSFLVDADIEVYAYVNGNYETLHRNNNSYIMWSKNASAQNGREIIIVTPRELDSDSRKHYVRPDSVSILDRIYITYDAVTDASGYEYGKTWITD